jgi:hypothetical protein
MPMTTICVVAANAVIVLYMLILRVKAAAGKCNLKSEEKAQQL